MKAICWLGIVSTNVYKQTDREATPAYDRSLDTVVPGFCFTQRLKDSKSSTLNPDLNQSERKTMRRQILKRRILFTILMASMLFSIAFSSTFTTKQQAQVQPGAAYRYYFTSLPNPTLVGQSFIDCDLQEHMIWGTTGPITRTTMACCDGRVVTDPMDPLFCYPAH
jgi:hypothetical protein